MQHLELFTVIVIAILLVPFVIWRVKAGKKYEFDVYDSVWVVQEVKNI